MKYFKKDNVYPNEAFIQEAIERYFLNEGYKIENSAHVDLVAVNHDDKWIIEAKGMTSQITVDFNTCLGQLVKSMFTHDVKYAIAIPSEIQYTKQCKQLSDYFRVTNNLYILIIDQNARVQIIQPTDHIDEAFVRN